MSRRSSLDLFEFRPRQIMSEFVWKKLKYTREHGDEPDYIRRVMVIYSGGTLGMKYDAKQGEYFTTVTSVTAQIINDNSELYVLGHALDSVYT